MALDTDLGVTTAGAVVLVGAVVAVVAAFLPWFAVNAPGPANPSATGLDTAVGVLSLLVALAVGVVIALRPHDRTTSLVATGGGAVVALLAVYKVTNLGGVTDARLGLWLALVGGVVMLAGGVFGMTREESATDAPDASG